MAIGMSVSARNARLDAISTVVGNAGKLALYDGVRPATGGTATNKLAEFTMGSPFAPAASNAVLSPTLPANTTGLAAAGGGTTATWARLSKSDGTFVMDLSVGATGSGADVILTNVSIAQGQTVTMTSAAINEANA
jgi:hypothetical protein